MEKILITELKKENDFDGVKLISKIKSDKEDFCLWFKVETKYDKYLIYEKYDAFVLAILPYAIKKELDIVVEGRISEKLYYQLNSYLIPLLCSNFNKKIIKLEANIDNKNYNIENAVGTGISCGVDSLYTIQNHCNRKESDYNLTHLTFFNAGASGEYGGEDARKLFFSRMKFAKKFAEENKFEFVWVDTNMNEFLMMNHEKTHTFRSLACVLILQKLFSKYYYSSGLDFNQTRIDEYDTACYDILNMQCCSTEDITFYSTGMETNRIGKVKAIAEYKPSYNSLNVCVKEDYNCGECEKCKRTLLELDALGKLDLFKEVFDIDKFRKNINKNFLFLLKKRKEKNEFYIESYNEYKKRNINIPIYLKIISCIPTLRGVKIFVKNILPSKLLKKIHRNKKSDGWLD